MIWAGCETGGMLFPPLKIADIVTSEMKELMNKMVGVWTLNTEGIENPGNRPPEEGVFLAGRERDKKGRKEGRRLW